MSALSVVRRRLPLIAAVAALVLLLAYVALRSGPLAPVPVTVATVEQRALAPALSGIGTVDARRRVRIGPTAPGRIGAVLVDVGERVQAGQRLATLEPVDLDARLQAQSASLARAAAALQAARAQTDEAAARQRHAQAQAARYGDLAARGLASREAADARVQELAMADAALAAARANRDAAAQEQTRWLAERDGVSEQRAQLDLVAPFDALVVARLGEPGGTAVAGQAVLELVDPDSLWLDVRFDQRGAGGLAAGLPATVWLRSRPDTPFPARVSRVEPLADAVTEELRAKLVFDALPTPLPPLGELVEAAVALPATAPGPTVPNAALHRLDGETGVWRLAEGGHAFVPVRVRARDLDGRVQVEGALRPGDTVVMHSAVRLQAGSRLRVVESLTTASP